MARSLGDVLKHAWNMFRNPDEARGTFRPEGMGYGTQPSRTQTFLNHERSMLASLYMRIAIDAAALQQRHVNVDEEGRYLSTRKSALQDCLTVEANIDQSGRQLLMDEILTMFQHGTVGIAPVDTTDNILRTGAFDINSIRCGPILEWYPQSVRCLLYDEHDGKKKEVILPKSVVAIAENPLYSVMNEPNSTLQRLVRKLGMLDGFDDRVASGKLDIIIQLPYVIKSDLKRDQAEARRKNLEQQMSGSTYGIAYTDATEKITQLNRPAENNLFTQVTELKAELYSQLGVTPEVFNGTADEATMLNYYNRTVEPVVSAIVDAKHRRFLTKTARTQGQAIMFFRDPFKLVPVSQLAEIFDKLTRNEIASSNEMRAILGWRPSKQEGADDLRNKNLNEPTAEPVPGVKVLEQPKPTNAKEEQVNPNDANEA